jgi:tRNA(His) 5'-end guanylyltransferase
MLLTGRDLMHEFRAVACYVASDEIPLVFCECTENETLNFGGKVTKLATLSAGLASIRFNHYLQAGQYSDQESQVGYQTAILVQPRCWWSIDVRCADVDIVAREGICYHSIL